MSRSTMVTRETTFPVTSRPWFTTEKYQIALLEIELASFHEAMMHVLLLLVAMNQNLNIEAKPKWPESSQFHCLCCSSSKVPGST